MSKQVFCLLLIGIIPVCAFAQPQSGLKISTNTAFPSNTKDYSYSPRLGVGIAYQKAIRFTDAWHLTVGAGYNLSSTMRTNNTVYDFAYPGGEQKCSEESLVVPIAINYAYKKFFVKAGYQYAFVSDVSIFGTGGGFGIDTHVHSSIVGLGYNLGFMSCSLDYLYAPNRKLSSSNSSNYNNPYFDNSSGYVAESSEYINVGTIQLSVTIPLSKK